MPGTEGTSAAAAVVGGTLHLIDFGAARDFPAEFVRDYLEMVKVGIIGAAVQAAWVQYSHEGSTVCTGLCGTTSRWSRWALMGISRSNRYRSTVIGSLKAWAANVHSSQVSQPNSLIA